MRGPFAQGAYTNPFATVGAISSLHSFSQHTGARRWLVYVAGSSIYAFNPSTAARSGSPGDAATDRDNNTITCAEIDTPWQRHQSVCWGDWLFLVNGIGKPLVFTGYTWDYAGWSAPAGTPSATAMAHPHAIDSGSLAGVDNLFLDNIGLGPTSTAENYKFARRYRVAFINDRGAESPLSEASDLVYFTNVTTSGAHFARIAIPTGPAECVARRIYATQNVFDSSNTLVLGRDTAFYYHSTLEDNVTAVIQDGLDDAYLGAAVDPDDFGPWPVNARYIASFKGRLYATGANNSEVYYSKRGSPETWPVNNVIDVGDAHLGPTTAIYATQNALVVAKAKALYLIKDNGVDEPVAETLTRESGWAAHNTVREVPGVGLMGLSEDGVTVLQGTLQNTGTPTVVLNAAVGLPDIFRSLNRSAILNACAAVYHRDKEYWLCLPTLGSPNNSLVCVYHYERREWTTRLNFPIASILEDPTGNLLFGSYAATADDSPDGVAHIGIMVYSRSCEGKDDYAETPTAIEPIFETNEIAVASSFRAFKPLYVLALGILHGNNDLNVNIRPNRSQTLLLETAAATDQQYPQEVVPVYGTATFDSSEKWQRWRPGAMRFDVQTGPRQPILDCTIRVTPTSRYMTLIGFSLEVNPESPTIKPLKVGGG